MQQHHGGKEAGGSQPPCTLQASRHTRSSQCSSLDLLQASLLAIITHAMPDTHLPNGGWDVWVGTLVSRPHTHTPKFRCQSQCSSVCGTAAPKHASSYPLDISSDTPPNTHKKHSHTQATGSPELVTQGLQLGQPALNGAGGHGQVATHARTHSYTHTAAAFML